MMKNKYIEEITILRQFIDSHSFPKTCKKMLSLKDIQELQYKEHMRQMEPCVYFNGRVVDWDKAAEELALIKRAKYNKVFYDPASHVEVNWRFPGEE